MADNVVAKYVALFRFNIENKQLLEFEKRLSAIEKKIRAFAEGAMPKAAKSIDRVTAQVKQGTEADKQAIKVKENLTQKTIKLANAHVLLKGKMDAARRAASDDLKLDVLHAKRIAKSRGASFDERMKVLGIRDELRARKNRFNAGANGRRGPGVFSGTGSLFGGVGGGLFSRAVGVGGPVAMAGLAAGGLVLGGVQAANMLAPVEQLRYRFQDAYGGRQAGIEGFNKYRSFASRYGVNYKESGEAFTGILQAISPTAGLKEAESMAYGLSKFGAAKGMTTDNLKGVAKAISQMTSKDKLMREEVYGQLADQSPAALQALVQFLTGKTGTEANKEFQAKLGKKEYTAANLQGFGDFLATMAEKGGTLAERSKGISAGINRLDNAFSDFLNKLIEGGVGDSLVEFFEALSRQLKLLGVLASGGKSSGIGFLIEQFEKLATSIQFVAGVINLSVSGIMDLVQDLYAIGTRFVPGMKNAEFSDGKRSSEAMSKLGEFMAQAAENQRERTSAQVVQSVEMKIYGNDSKQIASEVSRELERMTKSAISQAPKNAK